MTRYEAQHNVLHLQADRLSSVAKSQPGLVAQQEVDDARGRDLATEAQVESAHSNLAVTQSQLDAAKAKRQHDQVLFDYARITAPFAGSGYAALCESRHSGPGRHQFEHAGACPWCGCRRTIGSAS